jgi:uncharacterized repeat protein (TIGR03803 family)
MAEREGFESAPKRNEREWRAVLVGYCHGLRVSERTAVRGLRPEAAVFRPVFSIYPRSKPIPTLTSVFEVNAAGKETVLYSFPGKVDIGEVQPSSLAIHAAGNLCGTTEASGKFNAGSVFRLTNAGGLDTLYSSHMGQTAADPRRLISYPAGNLYGTTGLGGGDYCAANICSQHLVS